MFATTGGIAAVHLQAAVALGLQAAQAYPHCALHGFLSSMSQMAGRRPLPAKCTGAQLSVQHSTPPLMVMNESLKGRAPLDGSSFAQSSED